jgi:hypothetical protein
MELVLGNGGELVRKSSASARPELEWVSEMGKCPRPLRSQNPPDIVEENFSMLAPNNTSDSIESDKQFYGTLRVGYF